MPSHPPKSDDPVSTGDKEVLNTGQEEVFSRTAVEKGMVKDPKAMDPKQVRRGDAGSRPKD
jgi:hypothetical protein